MKENEIQTRAAQPDMREIATTEDGRDITRGYTDPMMLQAPSDQVLRLRGNGDYRLYKEVLRDDQVQSCLQQRMLAVRSKEWEVIAGGNKRQDKAAADFLKEQIDNISWDSVTGKMLFGVFYGYAVSECMWGRDGRFVTLDKVKVRDRSRFGYDGLGRLRMRTMSDPNGELLPDRKFWHFQTGADHDDEPYGLGLAHWLYWPVFFKRNDMKFWLTFLEKFGMPTAKGEYPNNASPHEKKRLLAALEAINTDSGVIVPEGMTISLIEAARSGTADYTSLYDRMDKAIAKITVGQTASTEGTAGKLGNEDLQGDVREDLVKADADLICESFNMNVARWLTQWNFEGAAIPKVWRRTEPDEDLSQAAQRDKNIYDMGFKPTLAHIQSTYGGDWIERSAEPALPDSVPSTPAPATEFAEGETSDLTEAQAAVLATAGNKSVEEMVGSIRGLLDEVDSLEQLQERLLETWPEMDAASSEFAEVMGNALFAASMAGRYDIIEGAVN